MNPGDKVDFMPEVGVRIVGSVAATGNNTITRKEWVSITFDKPLKYGWRHWTGITMDER